MSASRSARPAPDGATGDPAGAVRGARAADARTPGAGPRAAAPVPDPGRVHGGPSGATAAGDRARPGPADRRDQAAPGPGHAGSAGRPGAPRADGADSARGALAVLAWGAHALFVLLTLVAVVRVAVGGAGAGRTALGVTAAAVLLLWYGAGAPLARRRGAAWSGRAWLGVLVVLWLAAMPVSVEFVWLAFPLFFLCMHLLPLRGALPVVAALTAGAVAGYGWHAGYSVGAALGPVIGAGVAVVLSVVQQRLQRESEGRRVLLAELVDTQEQLAASEREAGVLAERERLAREIHDTVAQGLSSIVLLLRAAEGADDPAAARHHLATASATAKDSLEETRRVVRALAPAALDGRPLTDALRRLVAETPVDAALDVDGEPYPLPTGVEVALLRVAQGALANVAAHARASRVRLALAFQPDAVTLDVADDGRGFDPAAPGHSATAGTGFGLRAMRTRLAEVGGELTVESAPGEGTALAARIPAGAAAGRHRPTEETT